jgi:hypothetical protein
MTANIAIATAERDMFRTLRDHVLRAGLAEKELHEQPLQTSEQTKQWIAAGERRLLVLDAELPIDPRARRDTRTTQGAKNVLDVVQASDPRTPVLLIVPTFSAGTDLEVECSATGKALMLPMDTLQLHQHRILRPLIDMLIGIPDPKTNAIPGGFRVIETEIQSTKVVCRLGIGEGGPMLRWNTVCDLEDLKAAAREYARDEILHDHADSSRWTGPSLPKNWLEQTRQVGSKLFKSFVVKAVGEHLFSQIESAAGGLEGLSFRFVISDADFYPAPFEASVRYLRAEENGPFVLLYAPIVRRVPDTIQLTVRRQGRIERGATLLFVRSQIGEHPQGALERVTYDRKVFDKLGNIDLELQYLRALGEAGHFDFKLVNLSDAPPGKAAAYLLDRINEVQPAILHYAGHAWSDGQKSATLILPGQMPEEALGLKLDRMAAYQGLSATKLVYLSACRGISKGSVQQLVMNGIPYALGFRWNVEDDRAPDFANAFYDGLCATQSVCLAFRRACRASWERLNSDEESPIWISPILLAQSADWATRSYPPAAEIGGTP